MQGIISNIIIFALHGCSLAEDQIWVVTLLFTRIVSGDDMAHVLNETSHIIRGQIAILLNVQCLK